MIIVMPMTMMRIPVIVMIAAIRMIAMISDIFDNRNNDDEN